MFSFNVWLDCEFSKEGLYYLGYLIEWKQTIVKKGYYIHRSLSLA